VRLSLRRLHGSPFSAAAAQLAHVVAIAQLAQTSTTTARRFSRLFRGHLLHFRDFSWSPSSFRGQLAVIDGYTNYLFIHESIFYE
jgi:hypothetical protein